MPAIAALFNKMTTRVVEERFTAREALAFLRENTAHLTKDDLCAPIDLQRSLDAEWDPAVYWAKLSPDQQASWASFQMPGLSWKERILDVVCSTDFGWRILRFIRRLLWI